MKFSDAALLWLQKLLQDRITDDIKLEQDGEGAITIVNKNYDKTITFPMVLSCLRTATSSTDWVCAQWELGGQSSNTDFNHNLPLLGVHSVPEALVAETDSGVSFHYDLLGFFYWHLTRIEELNPSPDCLDEHKRFKTSASLAYRFGFHERPIVDEWIIFLARIFSRFWPKSIIKSFNFRVNISHDVDNVSWYRFISLKKFIKKTASDLIRRKDLNLFFKSVSIRYGSSTSLSKSDPLNTFDFILTHSESRNLTSAFYFITARTDQSKDADYNLNNREIESLIMEIASRGHEVGLHPSYNAIELNKQINSEADLLRKKCKELGIAQSNFGGRMHFLRWQHANTLRSWDSANLTYDSTLGYADRPGFRCGTCHEYQAFDPEEQRILDVRIRPLIAMDVSVTSKRYMAKGFSEQAKDIFLKFKEKCRAVDGQFTLLWHNSELATDEQKALYLAVLDG